MSTVQYNDFDLRDYLDGKRLEDGDILELQLDDGCWLPVRYACQVYEEKGCVRTGFAVLLAGKKVAVMPVPDGGVIARRVAR